MVPFAFFGLARRIFRYRDHQDPPLMDYLKYILVVGIASYALFIILHSFLPIKNWLFYPVAAIFAYCFGLWPHIAQNYIFANVLRFLNRQGTPESKKDFCESR